MTVEFCSGILFTREAGRLLRKGMDDMKRMRTIALWLGVWMVLAVFFGCKDDRPRLPFSHTEFQGRSYQEIVAELEAAGFENIELDTMLTYAENKAGTVGKMTIDGDNLFRKMNSYDPAVPIVVSYYKLQLKVSMEIEVSGEDGMPVFTVRTNLPDGTILNAELAGEDDENLAYFEQREIIVQDGVAATEAFTLEGEPLMGSYHFGVVMFPAEQSEQVQADIGATGEYIYGNLVKGDGEYHYAMIGMEYQSPVEMVIEKISEEALWQRIEESLSGFGEDYEISMNGYVYTVNVWQDGLAEIAILANAGNKNAIDEWEKITYTTMKASESLQELLSISGYGEYMVQIQVLNDQNHDNTMLTVFLGLVAYNCVSAK